MKQWNKYNYLKQVYPNFQPRLLRDINTWILTKAGIQETIVKFIHGWTSKEVFYKHYLRPRMTREEALLEILHMHNQALKQIDQWIKILYKSKLGRRMDKKNPTHLGERRTVGRHAHTIFL